MNYIQNILMYIFIFMSIYSFREKVSMNIKTSKCYNIYINYQHVFYSLLYEESCILNLTKISAVVSEEKRLENLFTTPMKKNGRQQKSMTIG